MGNRIDFVILGAGGYMGINGLQAMRTLLPNLKSRGVKARLICVAEFNTEHHKHIIQNYPPDHKRVFIFPSLDDVLLDLEAITHRDGKMHQTVFYDATPASLHWDNLELVHQQVAARGYPYSYFGEKPIFLDKSKIEHVRSAAFSSEFPFFCELIETENPVFLRVKAYLDAHSDIQVKRIRLWRAGSSGIKKAIGADRPGVQGGALEDKSAHDLSITVGWLGPDRIESHSVTDAVIHEFLPAAEYILKGKNGFLNACNNSSPLLVDLEKRLELPADGLFSAKLQWKLRGGATIPTEYLFSWVGVLKQGPEAPFIDEMEAAGIDESKWLLDEGWISGPTEHETIRLDIQGSTTQYEAHISEARIGIVELERAGQQFRIICNFLSAKSRKDQPHPPVRRFAYLYQIDSSNKYERIETLWEEEDAKAYDVIKQDDLAKVFETVALHLIEEKPAECISNRATLLIHEALLEAQDFALSQVDVARHQEYWERIVQLFNVVTRKVAAPIVG